MKKNNKPSHEKHVEEVKTAWLRQQSHYEERLKIGKTFGFADKDYHYLCNLFYHGKYKCVGCPLSNMKEKGCVIYFENCADFYAEVKVCHHMHYPEWYLCCLSNVLHEKIEIQREFYASGYKILEAAPLGSFFGPRSLFFPLFKLSRELLKSDGYDDLVYLSNALHRIECVDIKYW